jgi:UDP-glucose 4-epimerase
MVVLVTGGAGYIGSHMALRLIDDGDAPVVLDNLSTGFADAVPQAAELVVGNVGDQKLVADILTSRKIDAVLHFAGSIVVPESVSDPLKYYQNNTVNSQNLIACCVEAGIPNFIFSSTAAVYGDQPSAPIDETTPPMPINPYGASKLMTEWMLRDVSAATDLRHVALRYFNVAGADPNGRAGQRSPNATHLIKVACEAALGDRDCLQIFGDDYDTPDGTCMRDYIHVTDLIDAHARAIEHLRVGGRSVTLNCGYGSGSSVRQVVAALEGAAGAPIATKTVGRRPGDAASVVANADQIRNLLEWSPQYADLPFIVKTAYEWEKKNRTPELSPS